MIAPLREAARAECARRHLIDFQARMDRDYKRARHLVALADHLEAVDRRDLDKLIVCIPPRHGKSRTIAQDFVAWTLGRDPSQQIILASYGAELAEQHSRRAREMISDERYPFADVQVDNTSRAAARWATNRGGLVRASGVGGSLTGFGAHLLIIDDAVKDVEAAESALIRESEWSWYSTVAETRLNARGAQVVVGTRWHDDDIIGRLLNSPGAHQWTTLIFPAIAKKATRSGATSVKYCGRNGSHSAATHLSKRASCLLGNSRLCISRDRNRRKVRSSRANGSNIATMVGCRALLHLSL